MKDSPRGMGLPTHVPSPTGPEIGATPHRRSPPVSRLPFPFPRFLSPFSRLLAPASGLLLAAAITAGCANYQLGTGSTPGFRTLYVEAVRVDALVPQAQVVVGTQLREAFLRDGRVQLVGSAEAAEAVLRVVLDRYERAVATVRPDDTGLARRFDVELAGRATLTDRRTGQVIFSDRPLLARRGVFTDSGLGPAEYQNLPLLAQDLARQAQQAVLDTW